MAQMRSGGVPEAIRWTILLVNVLVLPVPAPATINRGEVGASAARCCSGFKFGILNFISNIVGKLNSSYKPLIVAVFLVAIAFVGESLISGGKTPGTIQVKSDLGGPSVQAQSVTSIAPGLVGVAQGAELSGISEVVQDPSVVTGDEGLDKGSQQSAIDQDAYADATIQDPGISIIVPPTMNANDIADPGVQTSSLPNYNSDFIMPAKGYNYGILTNYNGVDIANACGTPIVAAAGGVVVPDQTISDTENGWNGGYGNFVLIQHTFGNGILTRYAHLGQVVVQVGDVVKQGQQIGLMGETGDAAGCSLHFEVIGARNPFAKS
jgi:murein DD-endopeptidase MepM/ murein hydrolase activator NlpD